MIFLHLSFFLPTTLHFGVVMTVIIPLKNEFHISFQRMSILLSTYSYHPTNYSKRYVFFSSLYGDTQDL